MYRENVDEFFHQPGSIPVARYIQFRGVSFPSPFAEGQLISLRFGQPSVISPSHFTSTVYIPSIVEKVNDVEIDEKGQAHPPRFDVSCFIPFAHTDDSADDDRPFREEEQVYISHIKLWHYAAKVGFKEPERIVDQLPEKTRKRRDLFWFQSDENGWEKVYPNIAHLQLVK